MSIQPRLMRVFLVASLMMGCRKTHQIKSLRLDVRVDSTCVAYSMDGKVLKTAAQHCQDMQIGDSVASANWTPPRQDRTSRKSKIAGKNVKSDKSI